MALEAARFVSCIGLPYAALRAGTFAPRDVGLQGSLSPELILGWTPDQWTWAIGQAGLVAALTLAALSILVWQIRRAGGHAPSALDIDAAPIARSIRDGVYAEAHWSFYRALPVLALASTRWAALAGLGLVAGEALLAGWLAAGSARSRLFESLLAAASAAYFALSGGNVWVALVLQVAVRIVATRLAYAGRDTDSSPELIA